MAEDGNAKGRRKGMVVVLSVAAVFAGLLVVLLTGSLLTGHFVYTPPFTTPEGQALPGSIAEFERVELGGTSQGVLIRGRSLDNPVVLFLHMGPGLSETGMFRKLLPQLEDHFTMAYLDMRGAGKSFSLFSDPKDFTTQRLSEDVHELAVYLKEKLGKEKVTVMGHSFGAPFGLIAAANYPQDFAMYIGIGQPVDPPECDRLSWGHTMDLAMSSGNDQAVGELKGIEGYWETKEVAGYTQGMMVLKKWVGYYGGQIQGETGPGNFIAQNTMGHEYTIFDWLPIFGGMAFCSNASGRIMIETDMRQLVREVAVPFVILEGRHDFNTYPSLVEEYFEMIKAPYKQLFWFENSAHFPHFEEKQRFLQIMVHEIRPMLRDG